MFSVIKILLDIIIAIFFEYKTPGLIGGKVYLMKIGSNRLINYYLICGKTDNN